MNTNVGDLFEWPVELFPVEKSYCGKVLTIGGAPDVELMDQRAFLKVTQEGGDTLQGSLVRYSVLERERDVVVNHGSRTSAQGRQQQHGIEETRLRSRSLGDGQVTRTSL
jgi:hypothetical protein